MLYDAKKYDMFNMKIDSRDREKEPINIVHNCIKINQNSLHLKSKSNQLYISQPYISKCVKKYKAILLENLKNPMDVQKENLTNAFLDWKIDAEQVDDVLVIGIRI